MSKLTIKQEKFALKYIECGNASEAYRYAYNTENMKTKSVWEKASELLNSIKVASRVEELKEEYRKKNGITVEYITDELKKVITKANDKDDLTNHRQCAMDIAKLHGLIIEKRQIDGNLKIDKKRGDIAKRFAERMLGEKSE